MNFQPTEEIVEILFVYSECSTLKKVEWILT